MSTNDDDTHDDLGGLDAALDDALDRIYGPKGTAERDALEDSAGITMPPFRLKAVEALLDLKVPGCTAMWDYEAAHYVLYPTVMDDADECPCVTVDGEGATFEGLEVAGNYIMQHYESVGTAAWTPCDITD